jgi:hypothetical protein
MPRHPPYALNSLTTFIDHRPPTGLPARYKRSITRSTIAKKVLDDTRLQLTIRRKDLKPEQRRIGPVTGNWESCFTYSQGGHRVETGGLSRPHLPLNLTYSLVKEHLGSEKQAEGTGVLRPEPVQHRRDTATLDCVKGRRLERQAGKKQFAQSFALMPLTRFRTSATDSYARASSSVRVEDDTSVPPRVKLGGINRPVTQICPGLCVLWRRADCWFGLIGRPAGVALRCCSATRPA